MKQEIVIINYGAGNVKSLQFAVERLGYSAILSDNETVIRNAKKVIFPGVGEASSTMKKLIESGLDRLLPQLKQPVLGICLGMQLLCNNTEEGATNGLGVFDVDVLRFSTSESLKVPQIGWNKIYGLDGALFANISEETYMYLVHSYYVPECTATVATTNYGIEYSTALQKDNFYGVQFHPEKSSESGALVLKNFLELELSHLKCS